MFFLNQDPDWASLQSQNPLNEEEISSPYVCICACYTPKYMFVK